MRGRRKSRRSVIIPRYWLSELRERQNLSQQKVADAMGIDVVSYNLIEAGKKGKLMNAPKLLAISAVLDVSLEWFCKKETEYLKKVEMANEAAGGK